MTTARARGLGAEVRKLRKMADLRLEELAERCDWSRATLGRIEAGTKVPTETETAILLATLGIRGRERTRLLELARDAHEPKWWEADHADLPSSVLSLAEFERCATKITDLELALVPGLLQTAEYTRAIVSTGGVTGRSLESRVALRLGRQGILTRKDPVEFHAILDESVLNRPVGGWLVMAEQLRHVVRVARRPHVTVQVLPFGVGGHVLLTGSQLVLEFKRQRPIVMLENLGSSVFLDVPEDTSPFLRALPTLAKAAMSPSNSLELIAARAEAMEEQDERDRQLA